MSPARGGSKYGVLQGVYGAATPGLAPKCMLLAAGWGLQGHLHTSQTQSEPSGLNQCESPHPCNDQAYEQVAGSSPH